MANELTIYQSIIDDVKGIISSGMESAYNATSRAIEIVNSCVHNLSRTHFRSLLQSPKKGAVITEMKQEIKRQKAVFYMQHPLQIEDDKKSIATATELEGGEIV